MDPKRWSLLQEIYLEALDKPENEREAHVRSRCDGDDELAAEVLELIEASERPDPLLSQSLDDLVLLMDDRAEAESPAPERIGPYRVMGELGRGGMGTVYRAERDDDLYERTVALKVLRDLSRDPAAQRRFRLEQHILARLEHPNIARLYDAGFTDDGRPYLGMELVEGESIHAYCDRLRLDTMARLELFEQVCRAVDYAHRKLVVHRDLKPSNILVDAAGAVKLLDFGIAKLLDSEESAGDGEPLTRIDQRLLTPEYASPEQLLGEQLTTASDVYSLGVVLHALLIGERPERGQGDETIRAPSAVCAGLPADRGTEIARARGLDSVAELRRTLRGDLDAILIRATRFDADARYPSAAALGDELVRLREGRPVKARPPSRVYSLRKFVRRNLVATAAAAGFLLALTAGGVALAFEQAETARERDRAELEAERANQVTNFLTTVLGQASPAQARGDSVTVRAALDLAAERVETELAGQPDLQMRLLQAVGNVYRTLGAFPEAMEVLESAAAKADELAEPRPLILSDIETELGNVAGNLQEFERAEEHLVRALELRREGLDADHTLVSASSLNLGLHYTYEGRLDEAEALLLDAVRIDSLNMVADTSTPLGYSLNNLGLLRYHQGNFEDAAQRWEDALDVRRRTHGPVHPRTVTSLSNLGALLGIMGEHERAVPVLRESLEVQRTLHREDHPDLANTLGNFAATLEMIGEVDEAEVLAREALEMNKRVFAPVHGEVAGNLNVLGLIENRRGNHEQALAYHLESLDMIREVFPPDNQRVALQAHAAARAYLALDRCADALPLLEEALRIFPASQPEDGFRMAYVRVSIAECRIREERYEEAEALLLPAYATLVEQEGADHPRTQTARSALADLYSAWGRPDEAARYAPGG